MLTMQPMTPKQDEPKNTGLLPNLVAKADTKGLDINIECFGHTQWLPRQGDNIQTKARYQLE